MFGIGYTSIRGGRRPLGECGRDSGKNSAIVSPISGGQYREVAGRCVLILLAGSVYAIIRYIIFGGVLPAQLPSYILNKSFAFSAALALLISAVYYAKGRLQCFQRWAVVSFGFSAPHVVLSLALWSRDYYPKLYAENRMNWSGELTLLFGALNACLFCGFRFFRHEGLYFFRWANAGLLALHTLALGFTSWIAIESWPGKMPPISMLSCISALIALLLFLQQPRN